jgi:hypothetical protein
MRTCRPVLLALLVAGGVRAGETDQFYAWRHPPADVTDSFNAATNERLQRGLQIVNRSPLWRNRSCRSVAHQIASPFFWREYRFLIGATPESGLTDYVPGSNVERLTRFWNETIYRRAPLAFPGFYVIPLDTTVRLHGVNLGTDKLAHFFPNGWRYYERYHEVLAAGASEDEAFAATQELGLEQELGWFGWDWGVFSFSDMESNHQGLLWYQSLCDEEPSVLRMTSDGWVLSKPFDIREWVNPCWDESYYGNTFHEALWQSVKPLMREYCPLMERGDVRELLEDYERRGCHSRSVVDLERRIRAGQLEDWRPSSPLGVCELARRPTAASDYAP